MSWRKIVGSHAPAFGLTEAVRSETEQQLTQAPRLEVTGTVLQLHLRSGYADKMNSPLRFLAWKQEPGDQPMPHTALVPDTMHSRLSMSRPHFVTWHARLQLTTLCWRVTTYPQSNDGDTSSPGPISLLPGQASAALEKLAVCLLQASEQRIRNTYAPVPVPRLTCTPQDLWLFVPYMKWTASFRMDCCCPTQRGGTRYATQKPSYEQLRGIQRLDLRLLHRLPLPCVDEKKKFPWNHGTKTEAGIHKEKVRTTKVVVRDMEAWGYRDAVVEVLRREIPQQRERDVYRTICSFSSSWENKKSKKSITGLNMRVSYFEGQEAQITPIFASFQSFPLNQLIGFSFSQLLPRVRSMV